MKRIDHINHKVIINRIKIAMIVFVCVILCLLQLFSLIKTNKYTKYTLTEHVIVKHNGKKVFEGNIDEYHVSNIKSEDILTMYMNVPKNNISNPAIQYDNINTAVSVFADNKKIYSIGEDVPKGGIVCHAFNKVPLGGLEGISQIVMKVRVMNGPTLTRLPRVYMMNTYDIDEEYYYSMHIYILIGYYLAIIGIIGFVMVSFMWKRDSIMIKMVALSITCLVSAIYMISMFQVIPLFVDDFVADAYFEYSARLFLPALLNLYITLLYPKGKRKLSIVLIALSGTHATLAIMLQYLKILYVNDTMSFCLLMYVCAGANIIYYYVKYKKDSINKKVLVGISSGVLVLVLIYVTVHLFFSNYSDYFLVIVPMAILVVLTTFFMELISEITSNIISIAKNKALEEMAYLDGLCHIANRRGFELYIKEKMKRGLKYNVFSFDLNGLKRINDNYGHAFGDEYIKEFALKLKEVFKEGFCARIGGDEFIAIYESKTKSNVLLSALDEALNKYNSKTQKELRLAYSVGVEEFEPYEDNMDEVLKLADEKMYKMKAAR